MANEENPIGVRLPVRPVEGNGVGYVEVTGGVGTVRSSKKESFGGPRDGRPVCGNP